MKKESDAYFTVEAAILYPDNSVSYFINDLFCYFFNMTDACWNRI